MRKSEPDANNLMRLRDPVENGFNPVSSGTEWSALATDRYQNFPTSIKRECGVAYNE